MKVIKKILAAFLVSLMLTPVSVFAATKDSMKTADDINASDVSDISMLEEEMLIKLREQYFGYDYIIGGHDIKIVINEDNTYNITENFSEYHLVPSKGVKKFVKLKSKIPDSSDGTKVRIAQISDVSTNSTQSIKTSKNNDVFKMEIGNETVTGIQKTSVSYKYDCGNDPFEGEDSFYYNFMEGFEVPVLKTQFVIVLPKEYDPANIKINTDNTQYSVQYEAVGNRISGTYNSVIMPEEKLAVQIKLPEDYFIKREVNEYVGYFYYIPLGFVVIFGLIWLIAGKNKKLKVKINSYPPEGITSLDVNYVKNGKVTDEGVASLFLSLANKGYVSVEYSDGNLLVNRKKDYDGDDEMERIFYDGLFGEETYNKSNPACIAKLRLKSIKEEKDYIQSGYYDAVTVKDIKEHFKITKEKIKQAEDKENHSELYKTNKIPEIIGLIFAFVFYTAAIFIPYISIHELAGLSIKKILLVMLPFIFIALIIRITVEFSKYKYSKLIGAAGTVISFLFMFLILNSNGFLQPIKETSLLLFAADCLAITGVLIIRLLFKKRTKSGNKLYYAIKGFETFIQTCETEELLPLVDKNPDYFYEMLGYAYALGLGNTWVKKFKKMLYKPSWYRGEFSGKELGKSLNGIFSSLSGK